MEARLAQLEVLADQNRSDGRAATLEISSLSMTVDPQLETPLADAGSTNSNCSEIKAKIRANNY